MSKRDDLRRVRAGTIINLNSTKMESELGRATVSVVERLEEQFPGLIFDHSQRIYLHEIVDHLRAAYPSIDFSYHFRTSFLMPDGGVLYLVDSEGIRHPILISEAKRQGTNDLRAAEGLAKQSKGNAIERLGKNLTGFRSWLSTETIMPFVCFGEGVDFEDGSSILDRVSTIAMFGPLNEVDLTVHPDAPTFARGSFYFRVDRWTADEMATVLADVAERSIYYYFSKFGKEAFTGDHPSPLGSATAEAQ